MTLLVGILLSAWLVQELVNAPRRGPHPCLDLLSSGDTHERKA